MTENNKLFTVRMSEELREEFISKAKSEGSSARQLILSWVNQYLGYESSQDEGERDRVKKLEEKVAMIESQLATLMASQNASQLNQASHEDSPTESPLESTKPITEDESLASHNEPLKVAISQDNHYDSQEASHNDSQEDIQTVRQEDSQEESQEARHNGRQEDIQTDSQTDRHEASHNDSHEDIQTDSQTDKEDDSHEDIQTDRQEASHNDSHESKDTIARSLPDTLSYPKLAEAYGISPNTLRNWMNGSTTPRGNSKIGRSKEKIWKEIKANWELGEDGQWHKR